MHKKSGYQEPAQHPLVKQILAKPTGRKTPLKADLVKKLVQQLAQGNLLEIQTTAFVVLGFYGFLRWDDLSNLTVDSLRFQELHLAIFLEKRKNEPVPRRILVEWFIGRRGHKERSKLFCRILHTKNGFKLREEPMTYSRANQLLKMELKNEGLSSLSSSLNGAVTKDKFGENFCK